MSVHERDPLFLLLDDEFARLDDFILSVNEMVSLYTCKERPFSEVI